MLLQHAWLAPFDKIDTISEEDEEAAEAGGTDGSKAAIPQAEQDGALGEKEQYVDKDVGEWVREQIRKKKEGLLGKHRKPALHAAPLDAVPSPTLPKRNAGAVAV